MFVSERPADLPDRSSGQPKEAAHDARMWPATSRDTHRAVAPSEMIRRMVAHIERRARVIAVAAFAATLAAAALTIAGASGTPMFLVSAVALGGLAALVGEATYQLGARFGAGATGVLQSALGNLPELFISLFALQAGLTVVVQTALVGSILANSLLVLGVAFIVGGARHGTQHFGSEQTRMMAVLLVLAVGALVVPFLATVPGAPDEGHARDLSIIVSVVLLVVFAASVPFSIRGGHPGVGASGPTVAVADRWPISLTVGVLAVTGLAAAFVSDWFVSSLVPAMGALGVSETFVGLVVVAIAGNAVENVVGVVMAARNQADLAISLIQNSSLQVALFLAPVLVLISAAAGLGALTLVVTPLLIGALAMAALLVAFIVFDGESNWLEGLALVGLYLIIAASVWWGPTIAG
jgi:Ca2+:H+ antiporter